MSSEKSLFKFIQDFADEKACIEHLTKIRWSNGAFCSIVEVCVRYHYAERKRHRCGDCRVVFSIRGYEGFKTTTTLGLAIHLQSQKERKQSSTNGRFRYHTKNRVVLDTPHS